MKSCFGCKWCGDVERWDGGGQFTCNIPLPPWRFRHGDTIALDTHYPEGTGKRVESVDDMAEICAHYTESPK